MQERVDFCVECLGNRLLKSQIKRAFWAKFDPDTKDEKGKGQRTAVKTIEGYLSRAREQMTETFKERAAIHATNAVSFLQSVIRNPKARYIEKLRAQEQLTELLGLAAAKKVEITEGKALGESTRRKIDSIFGIVRRPGMPVLKEAEPINGNGHATNGSTNGTVANGNGHHVVDAAEMVEDKEALEAMG